MVDYYSDPETDLALAVIYGVNPETPIFLVINGHTERCQSCFQYIEKRDVFFDKDSGLRFHRHCVEKCAEALKRAQELAEKFLPPDYQRVAASFQHLLPRLNPS